MAGLFVSHSHKDDAAAAVLAEALSAFGHTVWIDDQLRAGSDFTGVIDAQIRAADFVIVLWSAASIESTWVIAEATLAKDLGKLIPARIDGCIPKVPFYALHTLNIGWQADLKRFDSLDVLTGALTTQQPYSEGGLPRTGSAAAADPFSFQPAETILLSTLRSRSLDAIAQSVEAADVWLHATALTLGVGAPKNLERARQLFEYAGAQAFNRAWNSLGVGYVSGDYGAKDIARGVPLVIRAAEAGIAVAQNNLGTWLLRGTHMPADPAAGFTWLHRAALGGDATGQENLAWCHYKGEGVPKNLMEATYWFERAAAAGHGGAMCMLGALHADGVLSGSTDEKALGQFQAAWASGQTQAGRYLGALYLETRREIYSPEKGVEWFLRAGRSGDRDAYVELARLVLAAGGRLDTFVDMRFVLASAADQGSAPALVMLAEMLAAGRYGPRDEKGAREAFEQVIGMPQTPPEVAERARTGLAGMAPRRIWNWFAR